jgi:hypothetical protein
MKGADCVLNIETATFIVVVIGAMVAFARLMLEIVNVSRSK